MQNLREYAKSIFRASLEAADPEKCLGKILSEKELPKPSKYGRTYAVAVGKAAPAMMREFLRHAVGPVEKLVVTHYENDPKLETVDPDTLYAGHPLPDKNGQISGQKIIDMLSKAGQDDQVIALISGGGSALIPAPIDGISLDDKIEINRLLLSSGLDITSMNIIRQQLSDLKGGGFLKYAEPAPVTTYILSDVVSDDMRFVASGPTLPPIGSKGVAMDLCIQSGLWQSLPLSVQKSLSKPTMALKTETESDKFEHCYLVGSNRTSLNAAVKEAEKSFDVRLAPNPLVGDVSEAALEVVDLINESKTNTPRAFLFGGETTVKVKGIGKGGRNQELALRVVLELERRQVHQDWVFLSASTDGRDGPTDAAGAIVSNDTCKKIRLADGLISQFLDNNNSYEALELSGDLLKIGPSGTNVADIQVLLVGACSR